MKKVINTLLIIIVIFSVFSSNFNCFYIFAENGNSVPEQIGVNENTPEYQIAKYDEVAKNGYLTMYADPKGWFCIKNNSTGYFWYSHPNDSLDDKKTVGINKRNFQSEVIVYYVYKDEESETSSYAEASINSHSLIQNEWIKTERITNGIKVTYDFYPISARVCVSYTIKGNSLIAKVIGKETLEGKEFKKAVNDTLTADQKSVMQDSYITSIWVLPTFGAGNGSEKGFVFVPDGCGAYMDYTPSSHATEITNIPVYGEELSIDEYGVKKDDVLNITRGAHAYIPVFAISRESNGIIAVITKGDAISSINAYKAGSSNSYTGVSVQMDVSRVTYATIGNRRVQGIAQAFTVFPDFEVTYDFLSNEELTISDFANYLREKWIKSKIIKKQEYNSTLALKIIGSVDVDSHFFGFPVRKIKSLTTINQATKIIDWFLEKSVDVSVNYIGWNNNGVQNAKIVKKAIPNMSLGKVAELDDLVAKCDSLYLDADLVTFKKTGNGVIKNRDSVKSAFDKPVLMRDFSYSTFKYDSNGVYLLSPKKINDVFKKYNKSLDKLSTGVGVSFNSICNSCYSDFASEPCSRIQTVNCYKKVFSSVQRAMSSDSANAYVFPYVSRIFNAPNCSSRQRIYDGEVPFYQILLHGYVAVTSPYLNQCATEDSAFLRAVETGSELAYLIMYEDSTTINATDYDDLYGTTFNMLKSGMLKSYEMYSELIKKISNEAIIDYSIYNQNVRKTVYENGVSVFVNYSDDDFQIEGINVPAKSFVFTER